MEIFPYADLKREVATKENKLDKGVPLGYAGLDASGRVAPGNLPAGIVGLQSSAELKANRNVENGYAGLDGSGRLLPSLLPTHISGLPARVGMSETNISILFNQLNTKANKSQTMPAGGTTGQLLTKTSGTDYAASWQDPPEAMPASMVHMQFRDSSSPYNWPSRVTVAGHVMWVDLTGQPMSDPADWQVGDLIFDPS